MKPQTIGLIVAMAALGALIKLVSDQSKTAQPAASDSETQVHQKIVHTVEKTLHEHQGEGTPFVQAFEEALEEEARHEQDLAKANGLKV